MQNNMLDLFNCYRTAIRFNMKYVGVLIELPNKKTELIVNTIDNFLEKYDYYEQAYTNDLKLKSNEEISILSFSCGNSLNDIEQDLYSS